MLRDPAEANLNVESAEDGVYLRRMDSTSAKQYLHSMVCSVYSWGSDFDVSPEGATAAAHQNGDASSRGASMHLYDNLETLKQARGSSATPPPRPPKKGHSAGGHYLNVAEQLRRQRWRHFLSGAVALVPGKGVFFAELDIVCLCVCERESTDNRFSKKILLDRLVRQNTAEDLIQLWEN